MNISYPGLKEFTKEKILQGLETKRIYELAQRNFGYDSDLKTFYRYISKAKKSLTDMELEAYGEDENTIEDKFITILEKRKTVNGDELCDELSCSPSEIYDLIQHFRSKGYEIIMDEKRVMLSRDVIATVNKIDKSLEETEIIFGVASDLHFGSKACQITALKEFYEICLKKGVKYIFAPGDIVAGYNVYPGQQYEVYALSAEEQEESVIVNLPKGPIEWYMMGGNHDYSFIKRGGGHNPILAIESQRADVHYVGFDDVDIPILNGVDVKLFHPDGNNPYSISYKLQRTTEQIAYAELAKVCLSNKPMPSIRFLLSGHLHIQMQAIFGTIFAAQCGCFEGQTGYLKRKGLRPLVGGYVIQANLRKKDGIILNFDAKYYMFPDEIQDDWKNYTHTRSENLTIKKPLFEK
jgi:biotin operon repressor